MKRVAATVVCLACLAGSWPAAQTRTAPAGQPRETVTPAQLAAAIEKLGTVDYAARTNAARTVRRADPAAAVPALIQTVEKNPDSYVRFRSLVVLSGFNDPRTHDVMQARLRVKDDRLRSVAYTYFERNPDPAVLPALLAAVDTESSEFVRPALTRALAAYGSDPRARTVMSGLVMKGQAVFRSIAIEALGDYKGAYAIKPITDVARIDGPLQDDAALALGKIGDKASLPVLAGLQRTAPRESQPSIAAAICLLGVNCDSHQGYITDALRFSIANIGFQELLRSSAAALAALAVAGREDAAVELIEQGGPSRDPARAAIALALGTVALRNTPAILKVLERPGMLAPGADLLRDAFDMLEEDFEEERFFATVRRTYWTAAPGSAERTVRETLIGKLEF